MQRDARALQEEWEQLSGELLCRHPRDVPAATPARQQQSLAAPGAALGERPAGRSGETDPMLPAGSGEVKASVGPASSKGAASRFPSPKRFLGPLKRRCPDLQTHALATSVHLARAGPMLGPSPGSAVCGFSLKSSGNRWGQVRV